MKAISRPAPTLWSFLVIAVGMAGLAGCGGSDVRPSSAEIASQGPFGMIIEAYKSGQYIVDGGVVAAQDLGGHLRSLKTRARCREKILLENSSEAKIRSEHLRQFTQLAGQIRFPGLCGTQGQD